MAKSSSKKTITNINTSMAEQKTKTAKRVKVIKKLRPTTDTSLSPEPVIKEVNRQPFGFLVKLFLVVAIGTVLYLVAQKYRSSFLVGTINSMPVSRYELNRRMAEKYGKQTFDEIVNEKLLSDQLKKDKIVVTEQEVTDEVAKIINEYGGEEAFKSALAQYGLTESKARDSIKQSLSLKKVIEKNYTINITDAQIKKYFDDNKTLFSGKKFDDVKDDIKESLYQQEIYTKSQEWFSNIRNSAKIVSFL